MRVPMDSEISNAKRAKSLISKGKPEMSFFCKMCFHGCGFEKMKVL